VDAAGIAAQLDPEEWGDLVGSYLDAASAAVAEMGGYVVKNTWGRPSRAFRLSARMKIMPSARR
jgi:class 3 adenylate cyclase